MNIQNVHGIIWDLDGTLLDSFGIFINILIDVVKLEGRTMPSHDECLRNFHGSLEETIQNVLGLKTPKELSTTVNVFLSLQDGHYQGDLNNHLFSDAAKLAKQATSKNIKQLIVTNRAHENRGNASPRSIVAGTILVDHIHEIRASDEVEYRKPDERSVGDWFKNIGIDQKNILVIGDQHVDAQLANNLGVRALIVGRNGTVPHLNPLDYEKDRLIIVDDLHEIVFV
jgi:phosphoglycolate phosphatase-like HAD superfamily hydrolase